MLSHRKAQNVHLCYSDQLCGLGAVSAGVSVSTCAGAGCPFRASLRRRASSRLRARPAQRLLQPLRPRAARGGCSDPVHVVPEHPVAPLG